MATPTLAEYYDQLARHDWTYMMSDDSGVYKRGAQARANLEREAKASATHKKLFDEYSNFAWGKGPKPERPA